MQIAAIHRHRGAVGFVVAAIVITAVAAALLLRHDGSSERVHITGPGAAPAPSPRVVRHGTVPNSPFSAQQSADDASGPLEVPPLPDRAFDRPTAEYRAYASGKAATLTIDVRALTAALRHGNRVSARAAWARADSTFARIGAAYGALGSLGDAIDGSPGGLPGGVHDPHFTGLQRIEIGLWGVASPRSLARYGVRLQHDVARLRHVLPTSPIDPLTYATRAHEILEDVQRDRLTTVTPSQSGVRDTADGIAATEVVLGTLGKVLAGRGDALGQSEVWLHRLHTTVASIRRAHGGRYPALSRLSRRERDELDGRLGATLEALDGIPGELETIRPPHFARIPK